MKWVASELKECNIGGGVATKSSQDGGLPRLFFINTRREVEIRQVEPGEGWRGRGGEASIFEQEVNFSVTGVCVWWGAFTQCGDIPLLLTGSKNF